MARHTRLLRQATLASPRKCDGSSYTGLTRGVFAVAVDVTTGWIASVRYRWCDRSIRAAEGRSVLRLRSQADAAERSL